MAINRKLLPIKSHYFIGLAGAAPVAPFIPLMMKELGFSATVTGSIHTVIPLMTMLAKPWIGAIADKFGIHKHILVILTLAVSAFTLAFKLVPPLPIDRSATLSCNGNSSRIDISTSKTIDDCFLKNLASSLNTSSVECEFRPTIWNWRRENESSKSYSEATMYLLLGEPFRKEEDVMAITINNFNYTLCKESTEIVGDLLCPHPMLHEIIAKNVVQDSTVVYYTQFWYLLIVILCIKVLFGCSENLGDSICFKMLGDKANDYGLQRMWGAAGWGLMSTVTGILIDNLSKGKATTDRSIAFYMSAAITVLDAFICMTFKVSNIQVKRSEHIWSSVKDLMIANPRFVVFLVLVVACGVFSSMVWTFLFWLIEEIASENGCADKSRVQTLNGLALSVNCYLGEIPFFFFSGWFLRTFGYAHCMTLVLLAFGTRFVAYFFLVNPWWILPIEVLNGISFGLFYATMTTYANALTPPGLQGTMQGLVSAMFEGVGISFGSMFGGYLFDRFGGRHLFLYGGMLSLFLAAAHCCFLLCWAESKDADDVDSVDLPERGIHVPPEQNAIPIEQWS